MSATRLRPLAFAGALALIAHVVAFAVVLS